MLTAVPAKRTQGLRRARAGWTPGGSGGCPRQSQDEVARCFRHRGSWSPATKGKEMHAT